jgi:hypothetical protein
MNLSFPIFPGKETIINIKKSTMSVTVRNGGVNCPKAARYEDIYLHGV